ncbi:MAG: type II toxin-antitoxin system VapC family toxin [Bacteroidota bacterium]
MIIFFDTNTCIYFLKGLYPKLVKKIQKCDPSQIKIPSIVKAELMLGALKSKQREKNLQIVEGFLVPFEIVPFDDSAAEKYAHIRAGLELSGNIIGPNDLIIASTVLSRNGKLITNNIKEFARIPNLKLDTWIS